MCNAGLGLCQMSTGIGNVARIISLGLDHQKQMQRGEVVLTFANEMGTFKSCNSYYKPTVFNPR